LECFCTYNWKFRLGGRPLNVELGRFVLSYDEGKKWGKEIKVSPDFEGCERVVKI
jgi:hypothetical protein